jgi:hypothetical protein
MTSNTCSGKISSEHVHEIAKVLTQAPETLTPGQVAADEAILVELARQATPPTVQKAGRRLLAFWDLDDTDPGRGTDLAASTPCRIRHHTRRGMRVRRRSYR